MKPKTSPAPVAVAAAVEEIVAGRPKSLHTIPITVKGQDMFLALFLYHRQQQGAAHWNRNRCPYPLSVPAPSPHPPEPLGMELPPLPHGEQDYRLPGPHQLGINDRIDVLQNRWGARNLMPDRLSECGATKNRLVVSPIGRYGRRFANGARQKRSTCLSRYRGTGGFGPCAIPKTSPIRSVKKYCAQHNLK